MTGTLPHDIASAGNPESPPDVIPGDAGHSPASATMRGAVETNDLDSGGGIVVTATEGGSLVTLWGEIDSALRDQAGLSMAQVVSRGGPISVDMTGVTFIDSSGLAFIIQMHRLSEDDPSQRVVLLNPPPLVLEMFDLIGLSGQIPLEFRDGDAAAMTETAHVAR